MQRLLLFVIFALLGLQPRKRPTTLLRPKATSCCATSFLGWRNTPGSGSLPYAWHTEERLQRHRAQCSAHRPGTAAAATIHPAEFAGELFGAGQPLDATRYFIVLADGIGHGKSAKPSDGLRARFPQYGYTDMVEAQYRLRHGRVEGQSPSIGHGHFDGRHAHLGMGRTASGIHGCADAAGQPARADLRAKPRLAQDHHRCHT